MNSMMLMSFPPMALVLTAPITARVMGTIARSAECAICARDRPTPSKALANIRWRFFVGAVAR
jgi:hypothetical protein